MGIHRINWSFVEEFGSPGDLRFRIETDIRMPRGSEESRFVGQLREAVESSRHEAVRDLLLARLQDPLLQQKEEVSSSDLVRVRRLVRGALSDPGQPLAPDGFSSAKGA